MLVLTRKLDEAIRIGGDIKITVLRVKGNTVRIGIEAPREIRVVRDELDAVGPAAVVANSARRTVAAAMASGAHAMSGINPPPMDTQTGFELLSCETLYCGEDEAVITTVVDSPQPSTSRLFVGKVRLDTPKAPAREHDGGDQAAPLRAFLRSGRKLQAAG